MRYSECQRSDGNCSVCSLSNNRRDCHKFPINKLAFFRTMAHLTQSELSKASGVSIENISNLEREVLQVCNMRLQTAIAMADVLGIQDLREFL